jgi:hypothetical protein
MEKYKKFTAQKLIALTITSLLLTIINLQPPPSLIENVKLDHNWVTFPAYAFTHDEKVLGRDFIFTYGPLFQGISTLGVKLHKFSSSVFSLHLINLLNDQLAILLLIFILLLIPFLGWWEAVLILLISNSIVSLRSVLLITCITLISKALNKDRRAGRMLLGVLAGVSAFIAQIYVFDIGIYSIALISVLCLFFSILSWLSKKYSWFPRHQYLPMREYLIVAILALSVMIILNLMISVLFLYTSESYIELFQYQKLSLNIFKGYLYLMGLPLDANLQLNYILFLVVWLFLALVTVFRYPQLELSEAYYHMAYLAVATVLIKNAVTRTDFEHLVIGFQGIFFFLPLVIIRYSASNYSKLSRFLMWTILAIVVLLNGVYRQLFFINDMVNFLKNPQPYQNFLEARNFYPDRDAIASNLYQLPTQFQGEEQIVLLGYRNYVAELYNMEMIAPTLQEYTILSSALEDYFIQNIEHNEHPIVLLDYDLIIDDIFSSTRYPRLFNYILENYHIPAINNIDFENQAVILEQRDSPSTMEITPLSFSVQETDDNRLGIHFVKDVKCNLLEIGLTMHYPTFSALLGTPGRLEVIYYFEEEAYQDRRYAIGALEIGEQFIVYLPTVSTENVWQIFYTGREEFKQDVPLITNLEFIVWRNWSNDPTYIAPTFAVDSIACIQP